MATEPKHLTVIHALPGRVRLKIPRVRQNPELARRAQEKLGQVPGVRQVEANPVTGSLLIIYDLALLASEEALGPLGEIFGELFPEVGGEELAAGLEDLTATGEAVHTTGGLLGLVSSLGLPHLPGQLNVNLLLPLTFAFLGMRSFLTSKEVRFPAWYDYLWFGLSTFVMLNRKWVEGTPPASPPATPVAP